MPVTEGFPLRDNTSAPSRSCWKVITLNYTFWISAVESHHDACAGRHMGTFRRRLFPRNTAADSVKFQAAVLGSLDGRAHCLTQERRDYDAALLNIEHHGPLFCRF